MPLPAGTRFGPFEIVALIGAGGMGEVYRARDTKLDRDVALKVLPAELHERSAIGSRDSSARPRPWPRSIIRTSPTSTDSKMHRRPARRRDPRAPS